MPTQALYTCGGVAFVASRRHTVAMHTSEFRPAMLHRMSATLLWFGWTWSVMPCSSQNGKYTNRHSFSHAEQYKAVACCVTTQHWQHRAAVPAQPSAVALCWPTMHVTDRSAMLCRPPGTQLDALTGPGHTSLTLQPLLIRPAADCQNPDSPVITCTCCCYSQVVW
jgi:hypothetical protein